MSATPPRAQNGPLRGKKKPNPLRPLRKNPPAAPLQKPPAGRPAQMPSAGTSRPAAPNGPSIEEQRKKYGGWSEPPPQCPYTDIPIMTTKKALLDGVRYHLMKFSQTRRADKPVDPTDQDVFSRPVTLHRRDPRQPPPGRTVKTDEAETLQVDEKEAERQAQIRAEREAQRAIDQAKIAPVAKELNPKRPKKHKEEKTVFNRAPRSEAAKKEADIRYEESLPWHLEDADGDNVWVGNYLAALSEGSVVFMIDKSVFRMVPLEKCYRFTWKPPFKTLTIEQAEALMSRKVDVGRWVMKDEERKANQNDMEATRRLLYGRGQMVKTESDTFKAASRSEKLDHDELDVSGDEFQDDDEAPHVDRNDDEETKECKERIRREQLGANLFGEGDEQQVDKELQEQLQEDLERKKYGKTTKKALIKRDREDIYESDHSVEEPWTSSSDDESTDDEDKESKDGDKRDAEGRDKDRDGQVEAKENSKTAALKGTAMPQGKQKQGDSTKKTKSLKRAGSPALSESSGNESSRKKMKTVATAPGSRAGSAPTQPNASRRPKAGGSDGEAASGDMSDGSGARKNLKVVGSSAKGSPAASRAGSPNPAHGSVASPTSQTGAGIEPWEILEKIPLEGIAIGDLIKPFHGRVGERPGQMSKGEWIKLVKQLCDYGPDKRLRRRK